MQLSAIRNRLAQYEKKRIFWRYLFSDSPQVIKLKEFLNQFSKQADDYELSETELIELLIILAEDSSEIANSIKYNLKNNEYYDALPQLPALIKAEIPITKTILCLMRNLSSYTRGIDGENKKIIESLILLKKHNVLTDATLQLFIDYSYTANTIASIFEKLAKANLLNADNIALLSHAFFIKKLDKYFFLISDFDEGLFKYVCNKFLAFNNIASSFPLFLSKNCLNKKIVTLLLDNENTLNRVQYSDWKLFFSKLADNDELNLEVISLLFSVIYYYSRSDIKLIALLGLLNKNNLIKLSEDRKIYFVMNYIRSNAIDNELLQKILQCIFKENNIAFLKILNVFSDTNATINNEIIFLLLNHSQLTLIYQLLCETELLNFKNVEQQIVAILSIKPNELNYFFKILTEAALIAKITPVIVHRLLQLPVNYLPHTEKCKITSTLTFSNDKEAAENLINHFNIFSQDIIEEFYLQPYPNKFFRLLKSNLKDGLIEREVHGAMHGGQVCLLMGILHEKIKKDYPHFVSQALDAIGSEFDLSEKHILAIISIAGLCHDSAREDENQDKWEKQSQINCEKKFQQIGISSRLAAVISGIILFKDEPEQYEAYLIELSISPQYIIYYQYIRTLLYLADCFEIMRCNKTFNFYYPFKCLEILPIFKLEKDKDSWIEFAKQLYILLNQQKNMLFQCKLIMLNDKKIDWTPPENQYSLAEKVKYEHAENVLSALAEAMQKMVYFTAYMPSQSNKCLTSTLALCKPAYNPFIHGTTSLVFANLEKTSNTLLPIQSMLTNFMLAPLGGELNQRSLSSPYQGETIRFGRLSIRAYNYHQYDLHSIVRNYSYYDLEKIPNAESSKLSLQREIEVGFKCYFNNITIILIHLLRFKQLGGNKEDLHSKINFCELNKKLWAVKQLMYFLLLLKDHIHPLFNHAKIKRDSTAHLTMEKIINKITVHHLDFEAIYFKSDKEAMSRILCELSLKSNVEITNLKEFKGRNLLYNDKRSAKNFFFYLSQNQSDGELGKFLDRYINGDVHPNFFGHVINQFFRKINELNTGISLLNNIIKNESLAFSKRQLFFLNNQFPIIFIYQNAEIKIKMIDFTSFEHIAKQPLKLGADIKTIATSNEKNRLTIMRYLAENHIHNVHVVLFIDLFIAKYSKKPCRSPYLHKDGFPRLTWLAANAHVKTKSETTTTENAYLIEQATQYQAISLPANY